jgi:hypothetical protein
MDLQLPPNELRRCCSPRPTFYQDNQLDAIDLLSDIIELEAYLSNPQIFASHTSRNATNISAFSTVATGVSEVRFFGDNAPVLTARGGGGSS